MDNEKKSTGDEHTMKVSNEQTNDTKAFVLNSPSIMNNTGDIMQLEHMYIFSTRAYERKYIYKICRACAPTSNTEHTDDDELYMCHEASCYDAVGTEQFIHKVLREYRLFDTRDFFIIDFDTARSVIDMACQGTVKAYTKCMDALEKMRLP